MDTTPSPTPRPEDRDPRSEDTQTFDTSSTQGYVVAQQTLVDDDREGHPTSGDDATAYPWTSPAHPEPVRPTGTSWPTVVLGLIALVVGGLVLAFQLVDIDIDWSIATPAVFACAGGVLVLLGVASLVSRRNRDEAPG